MREAHYRHRYFRNATTSHAAMLRWPYQKVSRASEPDVMKRPLPHCFYCSVPLSSPYMPKRDDQEAALRDWTSRAYALL